MTVHIESKKEEIAPLVIMPGDPLRAKYIAEKFLTDYKLVNKVRNMFAYTGYYKDKRITVFSSGMGIPSIGIYSYELYKFYDVEKIIRIGTCGSYNKDIHLLDIILSTGAYSKTYFPYLFSKDNFDYIKSSGSLNKKIENVAINSNINLKVGNTVTSDVFDLYCDKDSFLTNFPSDFLAEEMEAFGLFYIASKLNKEAACLMSVVDAVNDKKSLTSEEREKSLDEMITLALNSIIK